MRDVVFLAITMAFFVMAVGYVALCDRIVGDDADEVSIAARPADGVEVRA